MNMHVRTLGPSPAERAYRLALQERKSKKALKRLAVIRERAREEIDRLIAFLDETDGFTTSELELSIDDESQGPEDDLEPSLCGTSAADIQRFAPGHAWGVDGEEEQDDEPSLGFLEPDSELCQLGDAVGCDDDRELDGVPA